MSTSGGNLNSFRGGIDPRIANKGRTQKADEAKSDKPKIDRPQVETKANQTKAPVRKSKNQLNSTTTTKRASTTKTSSPKPRGVDLKGDGFTKSEINRQGAKKQALSQEQKNNVQQQLGSAKGSFKPGASTAKQTINSAQQFVGQQRQRLSSLRKSGGNAQILNKAEELLQKFEASGSDEAKTKLLQLLDIESKAQAVSEKPQGKPKKAAKPSTSTAASTDLSAPETQKTFQDKIAEMKVIREQAAKAGIKPMFLEGLNAGLAKQPDKQYEGTVALIKDLIIKKTKVDEKKQLDDTNKVSKKHGNVSARQAAQLDADLEGSRSVDLLYDQESSHTRNGLRGRKHKGKANEAELNRLDKRDYARIQAHIPGESVASRIEAHNVLNKTSRIQKVSADMTPEQMSAVKAHAEKHGISIGLDGKMSAPAKQEVVLTETDILNADHKLKAKMYLGQFILTLPRNWNANEMALAGSANA